MTRNIVIGGLMGSGKSTVGAIVAAMTGRTFVDTDAALAERHGSLTEVFQRADGDEVFAQLEHELVVELAASPNQVISTGGRTLLSRANRAELARSGTIVCLDAPDADLVARLTTPSATLRPRLAAADDRLALMADLRTNSADAFAGLLTIQTAGVAPSAVAEQVVALIEDKPPSVDERATCSVAPMDRPDTPSIPFSPDEATALDAYLNMYRAEFLDRAWGLSREQLNTTHPPSTLTLARLIGHMTLVEQDWFAVRFAGEEPSGWEVAADWDTDPDAEMTRAEGLTPEQLFTEFNEQCEDSRRRVGAAESLDRPAVATGPNGVPVNLRYILIHMIEEYARHCGHADLIRESIDGDVAR